MTDATTFARPYAKAIFQLAQIAKQYHKWTKLLEFLSLLVQDRQTIALLNNPTFALIDKVELITSADLYNFDDEGKAFVQLLLEYDRLTIVPEIATLYAEYCTAEQQTQIVEVCSAISLSALQKTSLQAALEGYFKKTVLVTWQEDPSLLGGLIIKAKDQVFDGSVRGQLQTLHQELMLP